MTTEHTVWELATMAACLDPDSIESAGAKYLKRIEDAFGEIDAETLESRDLSDTIHEIADGLVPVYTHEVWLTFVDLGAYREDIEELVGDEPDMTKRAMIALYQVAEYLLTKLAEEAQEEA